MKEINAFSLNKGDAFFFPNGKQRCRVESIDDGIGFVRITAIYSKGYGQNLQYKTMTKWLSPTSKVKVFD